jgi:hypothetical protein
MSLKSNKPIIFTTELYWSGDKLGIVGSFLKILFGIHTTGIWCPEGEWSPEHLFSSIKVAL